MAILFLNNINLSDNQLLNAKLQVTSTAPTAAAGQIYFDSTAADETAKYYSNATDTFVSLKEYTFPAGSFITGAVTGTTPKPIITFDLSAVDGTGAGAGERYLSKNNKWETIASIPGTYTWTVSDGTNSTAVASGETVTFSGTANEIEVAEASRTVTIGLPDDVTITNDLTVLGAGDFTGQVTIPILPVASTDAASKDYVDNASLSAETAEAIVQPIKANEALVKGDPVYIVGFNNGQDTNIVAKADSSDPTKMPVVGLVDDDYANQAFGTMTAFGSFNGDFDTTGGTESWAIGDIIFVKPGGGLTNIKPGGTDLIQNVAIVSRVQQNTGELEVIALGRTNDVPNLPDGRLFVGTATNTSLASDVIYVDDTNDRVGIGTTNPGAKLDVYGGLKLGTTGNFSIYQSPFSTTTFFASVAGSGSTVIFGVPASYQQNVSVQGDLYTASGSTSSYLGTKQLGSFNNRLDPSGDNYLTSGNLGIGTTSPNAASILHLVDTDPQLRIQEAGNQAFSRIFTGANNALRFGVGANGNTRMTILSSDGNVGIGTTTPASKLVVADGDIEVDDSASGLILRSPDGTRYRVTVANGGALSANAV